MEAQSLFRLAPVADAIQIEAVGEVHRLTGLTIKLPFLSNLDAKRDVQGQLQLAFVRNGSPFESSAQSTPFTDSHKTEANFKLILVATVLSATEFAMQELAV